MKTYIALIVVTGLGLGALTTGEIRAAEDAPAQPAPAESPASDTPAATPAPAPPGAGSEVATNAPVPAVTTNQTVATPVAGAATTTEAGGTAKGDVTEKGLRLNFRGVPLDMVLDYLSEAAGFIIIKEAELKGKVDAWSNKPLSTDEAVELLNTVLNKNDYAAIRNGRTLTIVSRDEAKKRNIPVVRGGEAKDIPTTDGMVTQVIPVRHALVAQLTANLQPLLGTYATMTANESANTLLLTATQADVRRMTEIINALDDSISGTSTIRVFPLRFADAKELATVVKELFAPAAQQQGNTRGNQFGGFGGFPGGGGGFPGGGGGGGGGRGGAAASSANSSANSRVVAVADERSNSLVVGAPDDTMGAIEKMVKEVDQPVSDITELRVFHLRNADPTEMAELFTQLFPDDSKTDANQGQGGFRFNGGRIGGGPFGAAAASSSSATSSDRMKKKGRVSAVADQRTSSIIVSAASELMPQIAEMVAQLDSSPAKRQKVYVYSLENADVTQVEQILQDMFQRNTTSRTTANQNSALANRIQQNSQATGNTTTGFGTSGLGGNGGGGGQFR